MAVIRVRRLATYSACNVRSPGSDRCQDNFADIVFLSNRTNLEIQALSVSRQCCIASPLRDHTRKILSHFLPDRANSQIHHSQTHLAETCSDALRYMRLPRCQGTEEISLFPTKLLDQRVDLR